MVTLILERHGQSKANEMGVFAGHFDVDMTPTGYAQAEKSAEYIAENLKIDKIYSSDLIRAVNTAKCVATRLNMEIITSKKLREICAGKWEGLTFEELEKNYGEDFDLWRKDVGNSRCTGGESVKELGERILAALTEIAEENDGKTLLISTHATPIRVMQCIWKGLALDEMKNIPWGSNASLTVVKYDRGKWMLEQASFDKHMGDMKTKLPDNV